MHRCKQLAIEAYRHATMPIRWATNHRFRRSQRYPIGILFYHRVADHDSTPWTISCDGFREHMDWLERRFEFISLAETQRRIRENRNPRPAVCITFDDGYEDNESFALPLLIRRRIPVTYFVTTDYVIHDQVFPHDEELGVDLSRNSVQSLRELSVNGVDIGAHTRTHLEFSPAVNDETVFDEVVTATRELEFVVDQKIRYFAIPFGRMENLDPRIFSLAFDHGFWGVCSAYGGFNAPGSDAFHLQRVHGDPCMSRMRNWMSWDPRVMKKTKADRAVPSELAAAQQFEVSQPELVEA